MLEIITTLQQQIDSLNNKEVISFSAFNPDLKTSIYSGTTLIIDNKKYIYRGYKAWVDLAHSLHCRMLTPIVSSKYEVTIRFEKLNSDDSFHTQIVDKEEKYGVNSIFSKIYKNEESSFLLHYLKALQNVDINRRKRVLNLGVNSGDEFEVIKEYASQFKNLEIVGVDYSKSAIESAKERFKNDANITFYQHDINELASLKLGEFDLIITIGTLQSSNLEFNPLLMSIVQNQLKRDGAIIIGFPNCRWVDGEMIYGAKVKNYPFSEMGLLYKDVIFSKKYLQQKKFRVTITGKDYIFITATSIKK
jgi:SAM-dependent methyltransferase